MTQRDAKITHELLDIRVDLLYLDHEGEPQQAQWARTQAWSDLEEWERDQWRWYRDQRYCWGIEPPPRWLEEIRRDLEQITAIDIIDVEHIVCRVPGE